MHAFQTAASAFCIACICAEITTLLAGAGWRQMHKSRCRAIYSSDPVPAGPTDEAGTEKYSGGCSGSGQHPEYGDIALAGNAGTAGSGSLRRV